MSMAIVDFRLAEVWNGQTELRIHHFRPQTRKRYVGMNIRTEVPDDKLEQYNACFRCLSSDVALQSSIVTFILTPPLQFMVVVDLIIGKAPFCFTENGLSIEESKNVFKDFYLSERWGAWG
jgi:predicted transcriptional regulator